MLSDVRTMQAFVDTMVGIPKYSYPGNKDAPRPEGAFAFINLIEEYQVGIPSQSILSQTDTETTFRTHGAVRLRFRIGLVDTDGSASTSIMNGWTRESIKQLMISTGYGFRLIEPISLEDDKLEKFWEPRQGLSVEMYHTRVFEETVNNITSMVVSGSYVTEQADTVLLGFTLNEGV